MRGEKKSKDDLSLSLTSFHILVPWSAKREEKCLKLTLNCILLWFLHKFYSLNCNLHTNTHTHTHTSAHTRGQTVVNEISRWASLKNLGTFCPEKSFLQERVTLLTKFLLLFLCLSSSSFLALSLPLSLSFFSLSTATLLWAIENCKPTSTECRQIIRC